MKKNLKNAIIDKFDTVELNAEQLAEVNRVIANAGKTSAQSEKPVMSRFFLSSGSAVGAVFVVLFGLVTFFMYDAYQAYRKDTLIDAIAIETVKNHINMKPLEVESRLLGEVIGYFQKLEFRPVKLSAITKSPEFKLLGGRYCSIRGISAAQILTVSADGKVNSWYQGMLTPDELRYIPDIAKGEQPMERVMNGLQVNIWQEGGLVFVRVR